LDTPLPIDFFLYITTNLTNAKFDSVNLITGAILEWPKALALGMGDLGSNSGQPSLSVLQITRHYIYICIQ